MSRDRVSQLFERFNQQGLGVLVVAPGRGRKLTYTGQQQARILAEMQREPDRKRKNGHLVALLAATGVAED